MKEVTKEIRQKIKAATGLNNRHVSIKRDGYSAIYCVIKTIEAHNHYDVINDIVMSYQSIDRDQFGEILSGANIFTYVNIDDDVKKELGKPYHNQAKVMIESVIDKNSYEFSNEVIIDGVCFKLRKDGYNYGMLFVNNNESHACHIGMDGYEMLAYYIFSGLIKVERENKEEIYNEEEFAIDNSMNEQVTEYTDYAMQKYEVPADKKEIVMELSRVELVKQRASEMNMQHIHGTVFMIA